MLPSGAAGLLYFIAIVITSLPKERRHRYNVFYYTHVIVGSLFLFLICIHARTHFCFLLPGLNLWLLDWMTRLRWLRKGNVEARLEDAGNGWYRIRLPPRNRRKSCDDDARMEPLQAFYLNFPSVSKLQCHAFTAAAIGDVSQGPIFLFCRADGKKDAKLAKEWTWKLAASITGPTSPAEGVSCPSTNSLPLRLEGPYVTPCEPLFVAVRVFCLVGGTGITGAISLAHAWMQRRGHEHGARFRIVWTVRERAAADLADITELRAQMGARARNMEFIVHVSSEAGRIDATGCLQKFMEPATLLELANEMGTHAAGEDAILEKGVEGGAGRTTGVRPEGTDWIYCSGPVGLLDVTDAACLKFQHQVGSRSRGVRSLGWYCAKWEV